MIIGVSELCEGPTARRVTFWLICEERWTWRLTPDILDVEPRLDDRTRVQCQFWVESAHWRHRSSEVSYSAWASRRACPSRWSTRS